MDNHFEEGPMPKQKDIRILQSNLSGHPSIKAWGELWPEPFKPDRIEIIKQKKKGSVYRLFGVGPRKSAVIAKLTRREKAVVERAIYEKVLPFLPVNTLQYYGSIKDGDGRFWWLFLEDVGDQRYSPDVDEHRVIAAQWLAAMHTSAECINTKTSLPCRGLNLYKTYLDSILELIPQIRAMPELARDDLSVLKNILSMCECLAVKWNEIDGYCKKIPRTIIHDDCLAKNVHVRTTQNGLTLAPFDWGGAGWGLPATDLGQLRLPYRDKPPENPDFDMYLKLVRDEWPKFDIQLVQELANLGQMFWSIKVIFRAIPEFDHDWADLEYVMYNFRIYETTLADSLRFSIWDK